MKTRLWLSIFSCLSLLVPSIAFSATLGSTHLVADAHHNQKHASEHHEGGASGQEIDVLQLANTCSADAPLEGDGSGGSQCGTDDGDAGLSYITGDDEGSSLSDERVLGSHIIMRDTDDNCTDTASAKEPTGALCIATDTSKLYRYNGSAWDEVVLSAVSSHTADDSTNSAVTDVVTIEHTTTGTPANNIGVGLSFKVEDTGGSEQQASIDVVLTNATNAAEDSDIIFYTRDSGAAAAEVGRFIGDLGSFKVTTRLSSIGGAELDYARTLDTGGFTSGGASSVAYALSRTGAITLASGDTGVSVGTYLNNTFTTSAASEAATTIAQLAVNEPQITVATETVTNSASVYIIGAATEATNDYALWVDAGAVRFDGTMTVGALAAGDGTLHVHTGSAGSVTAIASADEVIAEGGGDSGFSLLTPDANTGYMVWGAASSNKYAYISGHHDNGILQIATKKAGGALKFRSGDDVEAFVLDSTGLALFSQDVYITDLSAVGTDPLCWDGSGGSLIGDCSSLREWKSNIVDTDMGLAEVLQLRAREFDWDEQHGHGKHDVGFVAEEVEDVNPLLVTYRPELTGVKYNRLTALLVKAMQEQQQMIIALEARVAELE